MPRVTAVFDNDAQAERAVDELRNKGVTEADVAYVAKDADGRMTTDGDVLDGDTDDKAEAVAKGAGKGALAGAGTGALFGLAAVAIPGVGPFITAGWLASALGITAGRSEE